MGASELVGRLSTIGPSAQASVPAVYAWAVTVASPAWARGASDTAKGAAIVAIAMIAMGIVAERRWGARGRAIALWGFVISSAVAWLAAPVGLGPLRFDAQAGLAGMTGWALFAFASAAPPVAAARDADRAPQAPALSPRQPPRRGDIVYVGCGSLAAAVLCSVGWTTATVERALLVRSVSVAAGLGVLGATVDVALARHAEAPGRSCARRLRRATWSLAALGALAIAGLWPLFFDQTAGQR